MKILVALLGLQVLTAQAAPKPLPEIPRDYVLDEAQVLTSAQRQEITDWLALHEKSTTDQIALAIFKSLDGEDLVAYTNALYKKWSLGQRAKDNGILLAFYLDDRKVRIEVGYGLEASLTDKDSKDVIEEWVLPWMKKGEVAKGARAGVAGILSQINSPVLPMLKEGESTPLHAPEKNGPGWLAIVFLLVFLYLMFRHPLLWVLSQGATYDRYGVGRRRRDTGWGGFGGGGFGGGLFGGGGRSGGGGASGSW